MSEEGIQVGFLSYLNRADELEEQRITQLRKRLESEITLQIGSSCRIFQDRQDIKWGQDWARFIQQALGEVTLLFPVLTPGFFQSKYCRQELEQFLKYEQQRGRNDLILPIHYVEVDELTQPEEHEPDSLVELIRSRQVVDWRELRHEPHTNPAVGRAVAELAKQVRLALKRKGAKGERTSSSEAAVPAVSRTAERGAVSLPGAVEPAAAPESSASSGGQRTLAAHKEPVTLVVDPYGRHGYPSIGKAIQKAPPGARILIRPGLYEEALVIDKPLELIGDGSCEDIVVRTKGANVILFKTNMGRVSNLTLRQQGGGEWFAVDVSQGRLDLEDCNISSESLTCIGIHDGADPRLRRNRIHDGKVSGVFVYENGMGTLEDNEIWGNALAGVEIKQGGNPTLRRNRIHDGKQVGVFVYENGQGTLEDNEIWGNAKAGVAIMQGGNPTLRRNRIHDGKQVGVFVNENGQGTLEDNEIWGNAPAGVAIRQGGSPTLRRNRIHDGKQVGVFVYENGQGTLEDNEIWGNAHAGVLIQEGGNPTLRRNRIYHNEYEAVWIRTGGGGTFEDNDLRDNKRGAWDIEEDCLPNVERMRNKE